MALFVWIEPYLSAMRRVPVEWMLMVAWAMAGVGFWRGAKVVRGSIDEMRRRQLLFGAREE
jgi:hypothetical protein